MARVEEWECAGNRASVVIDHLVSISRLDPSFLFASMSLASDGPNIVNAVTVISNTERVSEGLVVGRT